MDRGVRAWIKVTGLLGGSVHVYAGNDRGEHCKGEGGFGVASFCKTFLNTRNKPRPVLGDTSALVCRKVGSIKTVVGMKKTLLWRQRTRQRGLRVPKA